MTELSELETMLLSNLEFYLQLKGGTTREELLQETEWTTNGLVLSSMDLFKNSPLEGNLDKVIPALNLYLDPLKQISITSPIA